MLHFAFNGQLADADAREVVTLSNRQAQRLFGQVEHWADQCGLDGLSVDKPIDTPLSPQRVRQRQKLWGHGSYQQIDAFLAKLHGAGDRAAVGELILTPVRSDGRDWVEARVRVAVDLVVGTP